MTDEAIEDPTQAPTPYRSVATEPTPPFIAPPASRLAALWGPALSIFGVLLWAFVVMGQLVTTYAPGRHELLLGEATGALFVLAAATGAWVHALRCSLRASPALGLANRIQRGLALGSVAWLGWGVVLVIAMIVGRSTPASDGPITIFLLLIAGAALFYARRLFMQWPDVHAKPRPIVAALLWAGASLLTLFALIALGSD